MKKIVVILIVSLFGFLGCGGSDDGTTPPGQSVLVAPFGIIETPSPTYEWTPVPWATKYRLLVEDTSETAVIEEWYTAEESGCASEDGLCKATPEAEVIGEHGFKVQACANENCGLWSEPMNFDFTALNAPRFTDNGDGTVTDNNTKLMWSKNANMSDRWMNWSEAISYCDGLTLAGLSDWRLPDLSEMWSLIDRSQEFPALPIGNPFTDVELFVYWTATLYDTTKRQAWIVDVAQGLTALDLTQFGLDAVWCTRGGQ